MYNLPLSAASTVALKMNVVDCIVLKL